MKLIIFSVHDSKAAAWIQPFYAPTVAVGLRMFHEAANDQNTNFHKHAGDFTLFQLGDFDQQTGSITPRETPVNHGLALNYREAVAPAVAPAADGAIDETAKRLSSISNNNT